jgi:flagellar L-ring protein FlgH
MTLRLSNPGDVVRLHAPRFASLLALAALLSACSGGASSLTRSDPEWAPTPPPQYTAAPATAGAIYSEQRELALFADQKARNVGDVITIVLVENTTAKTSASTSTSKDSSTSIANPTLFGRPVTLGGTPILGAELGSESDFTGKGDSAQSNQLRGNVTVTVAGRLPNGNLLIRGEKRIALNKGEEMVRIQGIVRPADIQPDNTVLSSRVADAQIVYSGRGVLAEANTKGWLSRFFSSALHPF